MTKLLKLPRVSCTVETSTQTPIPVTNQSLHLPKRLVKAAKKLFTKTKKENDCKCLQGEALNENLHEEFPPVDAANPQLNSTELGGLRTPLQRTPSSDEADTEVTGACQTKSELKVTVEDLKEKCVTKDREHAAEIAKLKEQQERDLKAVVNALETVNWKRSLAENRLKVMEDDKRELDGKNKALIEKQERAEASTKSQNKIMEQMSCMNQTVQQRLDDLQAEHGNKCKEVLQTAEALNEKDKTIELHPRGPEATNDPFNVSQLSQHVDAGNDGPQDTHSPAPATGRDQQAGPTTVVEDHVVSEQVVESLNWDQPVHDQNRSDSRQLIVNLDWEQPNHGISIEARYQETAEQCKVLQEELDATKIERDALAMAAVEAKAECDWWFSGEAWWDKEEPQLDDDVKQQLVYKDRLLIDLNKRADKGMTALKELKEKSRTDRADQTAQISNLRERLETATSELEVSRRSRESISKGYKGILDMLKRKLYQSDITDAISYYYNIVSSDNTALAEKVEFQAAELERLREKIALEDLHYRDLSRASAQQLSTITELETTKRSLEVELGRHEAEAVIGAQERKEQVDDYEKQLEQANTQYKILGDKVQTIIRLGAGERTKAELEQKDQLLEKLDNQLWDYEQRIEDLQAKSKVYMEAQAEDAKFAAMQDREYEAYKERLFAAEAQVVALKAELAERDEMLDGSNPLHLKEANVYKQALDTEKLDRREREEELVEECSLSRQQWETKVEALVAMGNLLWARSRRLEASLKAHGHGVGEGKGESESIDAACRVLLVVEHGGSEGDPEGWTEDGIGAEGAGAPNDGAMDDPDNEVGGVGVADIGSGEQAITYNESVEAPENGPGNGTPSANYPGDFEDRSENQAGNGSGDQDEDVEDDDATIRP